MPIQEAQEAQAQAAALVVVLAPCLFLGGRVYVWVSTYEKQVKSQGISGCAAVGSRRRGKKQEKWAMGRLEIVQTAVFDLEKYTRKTFVYFGLLLVT